MHFLGFSPVGFLSLDAVNIGGWIILCGAGGGGILCPGECSAVDPAHTHQMMQHHLPLPRMTIKNVSRHCLVSPGDQTAPDGELLS